MTRRHTLQLRAGDPRAPDARPGTIRQVPGGLEHDLTCPTCGQLFRTASPPLGGSAEDETLTLRLVVECPHPGCGYRGRVDSGVAEECA